MADTPPIHDFKEFSLPETRDFTREVKARFPLEIFCSFLQISSISNRGFEESQLAVTKLCKMFGEEIERVLLQLDSTGKVTNSRDFPPAGKESPLNALKKMKGFIRAVRNFSPLKLIELRKVIVEIRKFMLFFFLLNREIYVFLRFNFNGAFQGGKEEKKINGSEPPPATATLRRKSPCKISENISWGEIESSIRRNGIVIRPHFNFQGTSSSSFRSVKIPGRAPGAR
ncbi:hypothetical protein ACLOJK_014254 [Asimina triloba]